MCRKKRRKRKKYILGENILSGDKVELLVQNLIKVASRPKRKKIKNYFLHVSLSDECKCSPTFVSKKIRLAPKEKVGQCSSQRNSNLGFFILFLDAPI